MKKLSLLIPIVCLLLSGCKKDDPVIPNEEELITTLNLILVPAADGANTVTLSFEDLDGDGGDDPVITTAALAANTSYTATLELLNAQETPAENITTEVREEADEHQIFYAVSGTDMTISYRDMDSNDNPIGINTTIETGAAGSGQLTVTLRHEPSKDAAGVADGDITNAGGETDIEVTFTIDVE